MTGFDLLTNYVEDPAGLIRRTRAKLKKVPALKLKDNHIRRSLTPEFEVMANRTLTKAIVMLCLSLPTTKSYVELIGGEKV